MAAKNLQESALQLLDVAIDAVVQGFPRTVEQIHAYGIDDDVIRARCAAKGLDYFHLRALLELEVTA